MVKEDFESKDKRPITLMFNTSLILKASKRKSEDKVGAEVVSNPNIFALNHHCLELQEPNWGGSKGIRKLINRVKTFMRMSIPGSHCRMPHRPKKQPICILAKHTTTLLVTLAMTLCLYIQDWEIWFLSSLWDGQHFILGLIMTIKI